MTRRMIDTGMWSNENFAALPAMARLLQIGIINHADDQGRVKANPLYLAKEIFPYDRVTPANVAKWLDLIAANGTVTVYLVDGKQYAQLTKWWEYQSLQYAAPSEHPTPPNWKDRIRRTATKMVIVTYNWTLTNGVTVPDTCDERGRPLAPKPKIPISPPSTSTPPVNANGQSPDNSPLDSPESSPDDSIYSFNLIELNLTEEEGGDRARAHESPPTKPAPPPPIVPLATLPGVRTPQWRLEKRQCDMFMVEAGKLGIGAEPFRLMVDTILSATGKTALANTSGEQGQKTLNAAKQTVIDLAEMERRTLEDVQAILTSWRENDYRGTSPPTFAQIVEHASAMLAGTHITARRQDSGKKEFASLADYNEWAARHDPQYKRIREGILVKGTTVKRTDYQPELRH